MVKIDVCKNNKRNGRNQRNRASDSRLMNDYARATNFLFLFRLNIIMIMIMIIILCPLVLHSQWLRN